MSTSIHMHLHHGLVRSKLWRDTDGLFILSFTQGLDEVTLRMTEASLKSLFVALGLQLKKEEVRTHAPGNGDGDGNKP